MGRRLLTWALVVLVTLVVLQLVRGAWLSKRAAAWEAAAKVAQAANAVAVARADTLLGERALVDSQVAQARRAGLEWRQESQRLAGVVIRMQGQLVPLPPIVPDSCAPWAERVQLLGVLVDTLLAKGVADSQRAGQAEAGMQAAAQGRESALAVATLLRAQLVTSDSLLKAHPRESRTWLALLLDLRAGTTGQAQAMAGLRRGGIYAGVAIDQDARRSVVLGWRADLKVF